MEKFSSVNLIHREGVRSKDIFKIFSYVKFFREIDFQKKNVICFSYFHTIFSLLLDNFFSRLVYEIICPNKNWMMKKRLRQIYQEAEQFPLSDPNYHVHI